jgi:glycosyltransferase involved in cell wall biosynthesis
MTSSRTETNPKENESLLQPSQGTNSNLQPSHAGEPLVSVLMASYNHVRFVEQAVTSVLNQSYKNIEIIIVDDSSTDGTYQAIERIQGKHQGRIILLKNEKNQGISKTLNRGLAIANGKWIGMIASDDYFAENFVEEMMLTVRANSFAEHVYHADGFSVSEDGVLDDRIYAISSEPPASGSCFWAVAEWKSKIVSGAVFVSRDALRRIGGFDETLRAEDFDMHLRMARTSEFVFVNQPLVHIRVVRNSLGRRTSVWSAAIFAALMKHKDLDADRIDGICRVMNLNVYKRLAGEGDIRNLKVQFNVIAREAAGSNADIAVRVRLIFLGLAYLCVGYLRRVPLLRRVWQALRRSLKSLG